jgi:putative heme-binding domain-containing protein
LVPLHGLLDARQPLEVQLVVVDVLSASDAPETGDLLLKNWAGHSPRVQAAVMEALCSRRDRLPRVLDAIEKGTVEAGSVPVVRQSQFLENSDPVIRDRAKKLLSARISDDRKQVLEQYRGALALPRDVAKGKVAYDTHCAKCHALSGKGFAVGPDLAAVQNRPDESLLIDIFDPSSTITVGFKAYTVTTRSGKVFTGVLAAETATSITLRREQGAEDTILRREIESITASTKSLMPDGLEKEVRPQDLANLLGYLRQELRPKK